MDARDYVFVGDTLFLKIYGMSEQDTLDESVEVIKVTKCYVTYRKNGEVRRGKFSFHGSFIFVGGNGGYSWWAKDI